MGYFVLDDDGGLDLRLELLAAAPVLSILGGGRSGFQHQRPDFVDGRYVLSAMKLPETVSAGDERRALLRQEKVGWIRKKRSGWKTIHSLDLPV